MTINVTPKMVFAGIYVARSHKICFGTIRAIYIAMEQTRLDEDKALRAEATATRARENRAWWSQAG